nr:SsrA-binding protein [uncultured Maribacter sp.]
MYFCENFKLKKKLYKLIAKLNKAFLPSFSKQRLDLSKASKLQMAIVGWRYLITTKALD